MNYLLVDILSVIVPFFAGFHKRINLYRFFPHIFVSNLVVMLPFIIWDYFFVKLEVWGFNDKFILGVKLLGLPIEEYLFFICIPFSCVFTHLVIWKIRKNGTLDSNLFLLIPIIITVTSIVFLFQAKLYTRVIGLVTLLSLIFSLVLYREKFVSFLKNFSLSYVILLFPFLIVNGTLTGSFSAEPIVWYNSNEILEVRVLRIPLEDFLYAFSLIILNVAITDLLIGKFEKVKAQFHT